MKPWGADVAADVAAGPVERRPIGLIGAVLGGMYTGAPPLQYGCSSPPAVRGSLPGALKDP